MCAEQIPLEATVCEYCGTRFDVSVTEGRVEGRFIEEPIKPPVPASLPPATAAKQGTPWGWIVGGLGLLLILALVGGGILLAQNGLPFLATPTNFPQPPSTSVPTLIPTSTPNYKATLLAQNPQPAATAQPVQSPFVGQWSATDPDGSHLQLTITVDNSGVFHLTFYDDWANVCSSPQADSATGALDENNPNLLIVYWVFDCTNTGKQAIFTSKYFYEKEQDIIKEVIEDNASITWQRSK